MIVVSVIAAVMVLVEMFTLALPTVRIPAWALPGGGIASGANSIGGAMGSLSWWLPIYAVGHVATFVVLCVLVSGVVRIVRMGLSLLSGGGGSAA